MAEMQDMMRLHLQSFDLFNGAGTGGSVSVSPGHAQFDVSGVLGFFSGLVNDIGVETATGPAGSGYDLEATTEELHPLIGKRRWGSMPVMTPAGECPTVSIWTEAYEVPNNFWNGWLSDTIEDSANTMWKAYLNAIAAKVSSECGGGHGSADRTVNDPPTPIGPNPWR